MRLPINEIICGDCLEVMKDWPDDCVDLVFTSPPYWQARLYGKETLGREHDPRVYVKNLCDIFSEVKRVLKPTGSCYVVLGDRYYNDVGFHRLQGAGKRKTDHHFQHETKIKPDGKYIQIKQLLMLPERFAVAMQNEGWIVRNKIIWHKPNAKPTCSKDRKMPVYENIYHFVKTQKYYYSDRYAKRLSHNKDIIQQAIQGFGKHPASFPPQLAYSFIKIGSTKCAVVADPFCGSGTTCAVAKANVRNYIGIDISGEYCEIARARIKAVETGVPVKEQKQGQMGLFE